VPETGQPTVPPLAADLPVFRRILLVTDFSDYSIKAAPFARLLAEYYGAEIVVAHVITPEPQPGAASPTEAETKAARNAAEARLRSFVADNSLGESAHKFVVSEGPVWEALAGVVEGNQIDLIVLGTHGRSGVGKLLLGSVAQRIFSLAPCPVLSVSPRVVKAWDAGRSLRKILYATDFSDDSLKALPYALSLAKVGHADLLLLHAPQASDAASPEIIHSYHQHLNALIPAQERTWCRSDTLVTPGDPARVILDAAALNGVDFIVLGAHAIAGSLASFQVPMSTAYRVVAHAPCPVLRVRS
jgi:nucleotide-binding universal stress UspA family protein